MSAQKLKIVQLNISRAAAVSDQLFEYCQSGRVDVAIVQEPYTNRGKLAGFDVAPVRCFLSEGTRRAGGPEVLDFGAAIIIFNPDLVVVPREVSSTENFVSLDLDCGEDGTVTLISGYFNYCVPTGIHVARLETLLTHAGDRVLVALDANAFSKRWYSRIDDARGEALCACVDANNLAIANVRSRLTTFHGPRGRTNIDVTLADQMTVAKITGWEIVPGVTSSDHQLIMFNLESRLRAYIQRESRFNFYKANYEQFRMMYMTLASTRSGSMDVDGQANEIQEDINTAAVAYAPRANRRKRLTPPWW